MYYGPYEKWSELFFIIPTEYISQLRAENIWQDDSLWWPIKNITNLQPNINALLAVMETALSMHSMRNSLADKIDRLALALLLECRLQQVDDMKKQTHHDVIRMVQDLLEQNCDQDHDIGTIARQHSLSPTHFRRLWQQQVGCSPQQYLYQVRMRSAARMLVTTDLPIQEIASSVGHYDPLYFSKRFRAFFNHSPTEYRIFYQER
jgi:AraC-like DNA-binding protein